MGVRCGATNASRNRASPLIPSQVHNSRPLHLLLSHPPHALRPNPAQPFVARASSATTSTAPSSPSSASQRPGCDLLLSTTPLLAHILCCVLPSPSARRSAAIDPSHLPVSYPPPCPRPCRRQMAKTAASFSPAAAAPDGRRTARPSAATSSGARGGSRCPSRTGWPRWSPCRSGRACRTWPPSPCARALPSTRLLSPAMRP